MDKKTRIISLIGLALLAGMAGARNAMAQTDFEIRIFKVENELLDLDYDQGYITITYTPGPTGTWLSIGATDQDTYDFGIIVSNAYLPPGSEPGERISLTLPFNLSTLSAPGREPVSKGPAPRLGRTLLEVYVHILAAIGFYPYHPSTWITTVVVTVLILQAITGNGPFLGAPPPDGTPISPDEHPTGDLLVDSVSIVDKVTIIDLDVTAHPATANYAGDLNACTPGAVSNSLRWMRRTKPGFDLPGGMLHREILEKLSGFMGRPDNEGVQTDTDFLRGKLDFFEQPGMPGADVKFQSQFVDDNVRSSSELSFARNFKSRPDKKPTWDFFKKMMDEEEDVELGGVVRNKQNGQQFGHTVMATGYELYQSGSKKITISDDLSHKRTDPDDLVHMPLKVKEWDNGYMVLEMNDDLDFIITSVVAESPVPLDGRTTAAWLNELLVAPADDKARAEDALPDQTLEFVEIVLHESVTDLEKYRVVFYNAGTGLEYLTLTLDQFTPGDTENGVTFYYYIFSGNQLPDDAGGVAVSYSGAIVQYQFHSYGGAFTALDGDANQMPAADMGIPAAGQTFALAGNAMRYSGFSWGTSAGASPGALNEKQNITDAAPSAPMLTRPPDNTSDLQNQVRFSWDPSGLADSYSLQVATDDQFLNLVRDLNGLTDTSVLVQGLDADTGYFWRARAVNDNGPGAYSETWDFVTSLTGLVGDLNDDGLVNAVDLLILQHFLVDNLNPGIAPFAASYGRADVSADGYVDAADSLSLARRLVEVPN